MNDDYNIEDMLDRTNLGFGDITPLKNPNSQKIKSKRLPEGIRFNIADKAQLEISGTRIHLGRNNSGVKEETVLDFTPYGGKDKGVSRNHALITITHTAVYIKDFNSTNGTFINGQQLYPMRRYTLEDGDTITLGELQINTSFIFS